MYYIANGLVSLCVLQDFTIGIKDLHLLEVSVTYADHDCAEWHARQRDKKSARFIHVMAVAISYYDHYVVESILVKTCFVEACHDIILDGLEEFTEVGGAGQS